MEFITSLGTNRSNDRASGTVLNPLLNVALLMQSYHRVIHI